MDDRTLEALKGSIAKWEAIVAGVGDDEGPFNCPLCKVFYFKTPKCEGCPIFEKTGKKYCDDTPYKEYAEGAEDGDKTRMQTAAEKELEFLKSLLPSAD